MDFPDSLRPLCVCSIVLAMPSSITDAGSTQRGRLCNLDVTISASARMQEPAVKKARTDGHDDSLAVCELCKENSQELGQ